MTQTKSFMVGIAASLMLVVGALALTVPAYAQFEAGNPTGALEAAIDDTSSSPPEMLIRRRSILSGALSTSFLDFSVSYSLSMSCGRDLFG